MVNYCSVTLLLEFEKWRAIRASVGGVDSARVGGGIVWVAY